VVTLNNTRNLTLEELTFNGRTTSTHVVQFTGACTNLVIRNCDLLGDTVTTSSTVNPLHKAGSTGIVDNFRMVGCLLDGGYYNAYFYGGTGSNAIGNLNINIVWDSNTFRNAYLYSTNPLYTYFTSISYNTFLSRTVNHPGYLYMLYTTTGCHVEDIIGNRIIQRPSTSMSYIYGIQLASANLTTTIPGKRPTVIANNEVITTTATATSYGINLSGTGKSTDAPIYVLHNSFYMGGTSRGINTATVPAGQKHIIKNNLICMTTDTNTAYPIYLGTAFSTTLYDLDYNNMYSAGANVGYLTGASPLERPDIDSW